MSVTIHDVARKADVSISTVSRVVNNPNAVKADKRERVLKAIEELGYEPNPFASGLRDNRTMTIAAIISDISNPFYAALFRGIEDVAREKHNNVIICNTDQNPTRFHEYIKYFKKKKIDGIVFVSDPISEDYYQAFQSLGKPVVLAATKSDVYPFPFVKVDDYKAAYDAGMFFIKNGHKSMGIICGSIDDPIAGGPRYQGFADALKEAGIPFDDTHVAIGNFQFEKSYEAMRKLYGHVPDITAVFAASDIMALGAMSFLQQRGVKVPTQVSVMGFDNLEVSKMVTPKLTTVAQPIYDIGKVAATLLFEAIEKNNNPEGVILNHEIVVRNTVQNMRN